MNKKLATTALLLSTLTLAAISKPVTKDVYLLDGVEPAAMTDLLSRVANLNFYERANVVIYSPGGLSNLGELGFVKLRAAGVDTEVMHGAYSAAGMLFMAGRNRVMHERAVVHFHEPRIMIPTPFGTMVITMTDLQEFLANDSLPEDSPSHAMEELALSFLRGAPREKLEEVVSSMESTVEMYKNILDKELGQGMGDKLIIPNTDVYVQSKEAYKMGIATRIIHDDQEPR